MNCKIPIIEVPIFEIGLPGIGDIIAKLANLIEFILNPVFECINTCFYGGENVININIFLKLAGIDIEVTDLEDLLNRYPEKFIEWLNLPGLGAAINCLISTITEPIQMLLDFICMLLDFFRCLVNSAVDIASGNISTLLECLNIEIPWPFPCDFLYFWIERFNFNIPCIPNPFPESVEFKIGDYDLFCLLGLGSINELWNGLAIEGILCLDDPLCDPPGGKIIGFGDLQIIVQFVGLLIGLVSKCVDKIVKFCKDILKNIIRFLEGEIASIVGELGLDIETFLRFIAELLKDLGILADLDLSLNINAIWDQIVIDLPWMCVIKCLFEKIFGDFISPIIEFIQQIIDTLLDVIKIPLQFLGGLANALKILLNLMIGLGIDIILPDFSFNLDIMFPGIEDCKS